MAVTNKANNRKSLKFITQNVRGLKSDSRIEELFSYINRSNVFASCIQETWRFGRENLQNGQCLLLTSGLEAEATSKRGSQGVGIVLNATAVEAWKKAGCELHTISSRVMAVRLVLQDSRNKDLPLYLISAYAPVSNASEAIWESYYDELEECIQRKRTGDVHVRSRKAFFPQLTDRKRLKI